MNPHFALPAHELSRRVQDAAARTRALVDDLSDEQWLGPRLDIVNPPLWEVGHVANFYETFVLRELDPQRPPLIENGNERYNSFVIDHDDRWEAPLPDRAGTLAYRERVQRDLLQRLQQQTPGPRETYLVLLATYHEDMHDEAFTYTRHTLEYRPPPLAAEGAGNGAVGSPAGSTAGSAAGPDAGVGPLPGDVEIPGGTYWLGAPQDEPFVFDNEMWAHPVPMAPFRIARAPVTNEDFARFVASAGYTRRAFWSYEGWRWRTRSGAEHPAYWRRRSGWERRHYDRWLPLEPHAPVIHVNWYEAEAWCNWAGRRLPNEAEWELAASAEPGAGGGTFAPAKRRYPWGAAPPDPTRANLDGQRLGCLDVAALPAGDSAFGCRQMLGNVWEWTASAFYPFPGFLVGHPYREYSAPWFGYNKVLRGGCWATRSRLARNTYRNFFLPHRRDVFAGFRTCAR